MFGPGLALFAPLIAGLGLYIRSWMARVNIDYSTLIHVLAGVLQADPGVIRDAGQIFRLINEEDKRYFNTILSEMSQKHFSQV